MAPIYFAVLISTDVLIPTMRHVIISNLEKYVLNTQNSGVQSKNIYIKKMLSLELTKSASIRIDSTSSLVVH